jgi:hypothetical protein
LTVSFGTIKWVPPITPQLTTKTTTLGNNYEFGRGSK